MDNRTYRNAVDAFGDMVYRIALNQTRSIADAEDVTQSVFLKLYEKPPEWVDVEAAAIARAAAVAKGGAPAASVASAATSAASPTARPAAPAPIAAAPAHVDSRLKHWLIRVTVNECKSLWRTLWRRCVDLREVRDADTPPYQEPAFSADDHARLYDALGQLPDTCRIVVHLFYFEGYRTAEIAAILGIKEPTVRTRLVRARKQLKQQLKEAWDDEQPEPESESVSSHDGRGPCPC